MTKISKASRPSASSDDHADHQHQATITGERRLGLLATTHQDGPQQEEQQQRKRKRCIVVARTHTTRSTTAVVVVRIVCVVRVIRIVRIVGVVRVFGIVGIIGIRVIRIIGIRIGSAITGIWRAVGFGDVGAIAVSVKAGLSLRTVGLKARIIEALADFALLTRRTTACGTRRRNLASSSATGLSLGTLNARARIFDTRSVFAVFAVCALDTFARVMALVVVRSAELARSALDVGAKVALANTIAADLIGGTIGTLQGAVVGNARAVQATFAFFARCCTFTRLTEAVVANISACAFGGASFHAFSVEADTVLTGGSIVDLTVTVVVETVADFGLGLRRRASGPVAANTRLNAFAAWRIALARKALVDLTIAVVVFAVTFFGLCAGRGTSAPFSSNASLDTCTASGRAVAR